MEPEDEGAGPGDDDDATAAGPPMSVEVMHGPDEGKKKRIKGGRMVIGRGDGCDFKLIDTATSRRHLEVIVGYSGAVVRDLGSGNGTKLNGSPIDEGPIAHGDEITLGTTVLRVVDEIKAMEERRRPKASEPPPVVEPADEEDEADETNRVPRPQAHSSPGTESVEIPLKKRSRAGTNPAVYAALGLGGALAVGLFILILRPSKSPGPPATGPGSVAHADADKASALIAKAKAALIAADYDTALADVEAALAAEPANDQAAEYKKRILSEKDGASKLATGLALAGSNNYDEARKTLASVPADSTASDKATAALKELDGKEGDFLVAQAMAALAQNNVDSATAALPRVTTLSPTQGDTLGKAIAAKTKEIAAEDRRAAGSAARDRMRKKEKKAAKASAAVRAELDPGYRKFDAGDFERSSAEFERIAESSSLPDAKKRAHELAKSVRIFNSNYKAAEEQESTKAFEQEIKPLSMALTAYKDVEPEGPLVGKLTARLAHSLVMKGLSASARQDYSVAARSFHESMKYKPNQEAKDGLIQLRSHAHEVYLQAYEEETRDPESARKLYDTVMNMLNPGDEEYEKAKKRNAALTNRATGAE